MATWSYTPGGTADVDRVRGPIGDVVDHTATNESLWDEEIEALVSLHAGWRRAVAPAARMLAARLSQLPRSKTVGNELQIVQRRVEDLLKLAEEWERRVSGAGAATPSAGGSSAAQDLAWEASEDRPRSVFRRPE